MYKEDAYESKQQQSSVMICIWISIKLIMKINTLWSRLDYAQNATIVSTTPPYYNYNY